MKEVVYIPGKVIPKGRPRFVLNKYTGKPEVYTPKRTKDYEKIVALHAKKRIKSPIEGYLKVRIIMYFAVPKSWTKAKKQQAADGLIKPHVADLDNMAKSILDGMNGVAFTDDKYIYDLHVEKAFGQADEAVVIIETMEELSNAD